MINRRALLAVGLGVPNALLPGSGRTVPKVGAQLPAAALGGVPGTLNPEAFGAVGDGVIDDGPAWQRCVDAATKAASAVHARGVIVKSRQGALYRIATSITTRPWVTYDLRGSSFIGPIAGAPRIDSGSVPPVPSSTDVAAQTAGGCFTDDANGGAGPDYEMQFIGGTLYDFRYGFCSRFGQWHHPSWHDVQFTNCNIGIFAYQGIQEPRVINTVSQGDKPGTTFVAAATCYAAGNPHASMDNFFCDGLVYDNCGTDRDKSVANPSFDAWFSGAVLRPSTSSVTAAGATTFPFAGSATAVSGRNIYVPSRNKRVIVSPHVRRAASYNCPRGVACIGNPVLASVQNIAGERMFANGPESMVRLLLSNPYPSNGGFTNIDAVFVTNPAKAAIEVEAAPGSAPAAFSHRDINGPIIGTNHFA